MWPHPRVRVVRHESDVLRDNAAGDPHVRDLAFYVPRGAADPGARFPVVFVLTGFAGTGTQLLASTPLEPGLPHRVERLIEAGEMAPAILVFPDASTRFGGSQYLNSSATGRYQDYIADELTEWIDENLPTLPGREHRAVVGKSSGGFGALRLGMDRADRFSAVASHAGDCYFEHGYGPELPALVAGLEPFGGDPVRLLDELPGRHPRPSSSFTALNIIAMAACYSPSPDRRPLGLELPCDPRTGEIEPAVWARWLEHDPVRRVADHVDALRSLRLLYVDAGRRDEYHLHLGARILRERLEHHDIPFHHEEFDGGHRDMSHRYERSLPLVARAIAS